MKSVRLAATAWARFAPTGSRQVASERQKIVMEWKEEGGKSLTPAWAEAAWARAAEASSGRACSEARAAAGAVRAPAQAPAEGPCRGRAGQAWATGQATGLSSPPCPASLVLRAVQHLERARHGGAAAVRGDAQRVLASLGQQAVQGHRLRLVLRHGHGLGVDGL